MQLYPASSAAGPVRGLSYTVIKRPGFNTAIGTGPNLAANRVQQVRNPLWRWTLVYDFLFNNPNNINVGLAYTDLQALIGFFCSQAGQYGSFLFDDPDDNMAGPGVTTAGWAAAKYYPANASLLVAGHWQLATVGGISGSSAPAFSVAGGTVSEGPSSPQLTWKDEGSGYTAVPNLFAQLPLVQDATGNYYSPLQRNIGGFFEDVTDPNTSVNPVSIYANGVLALASYSGDGTYRLQGPGLALPGSSYMGMYAQWIGEPVAPITAAFNFYFRARFETDELDFEKFVASIWTIGGDEGKGGAGQIVIVSDRPPGV